MKTKESELLKALKLLFDAYNSGTTLSAENYELIKKLTKNDN